MGLDLALLETLQLDGLLITMDALHAQKNTPAGC
jgi:predicted transposase YbfD/YdcC